MRIPKRMALAVSGLAFAGTSALTMGAALPASAQTPSTASQHAVSSPYWGGCWGGWDWDWGFGCGCWDGGWWW